MRKVFLRDGGTGPARIFDELLAGHFAFLFWIVGVGGEHDDGVSKGEELVGVVVALDIGLVEGERELPNDSLDLLGLAGQSELTKQDAHGLVELLPVELHELAV